MDVEAEVAACWAEGGRPAATRRSSRRSASWWSPVTNGASARGQEPLDVDAEVERTLRSSTREIGRAAGYKPAMSKVRSFEIDEIVLRPGTYFNPQTEIMILVDDSPHVDHELFDSDQLDRRTGS